MTTFNVNDRLTLDDGRQMTVTGIKYGTNGDVAKVKTTYKNADGFNQTNWHKPESLRERVTDRIPAAVAAGEPAHQPDTPLTEKLKAKLKGKAVDIIVHKSPIYIAEDDFAECPYCGEALLYRMHGPDFKKTGLPASVYDCCCDEQVMAITDPEASGAPVNLPIIAFVHSVEDDYSGPKPQPDTPPTDPIPTPSPDDDQPPPADLFNLARQEAAQAERELELARPHGDTYKHLNTKFVAYRAAIMDIMRARASVGVLGEAHRGHSPRRTIAQVYQDALKKLTAELAYRKQVTLRSSDFDDRATYRATVEDYAEAAQYLDEYNTFNGREAFFTEAYYRYATSTAAEPDLSVDFDDLPRATIPETPVRDLTSRQLSLTIMQLLTSESGDEFAEDDKDNLLRYVRDQFPEAKNLSNSEAWANVRARLDRLNLNRS